MRQLKRLLLMPLFGICFIIGIAIIGIGLIIDKITFGYYDSIIYIGFVIFSVGFEYMYEDRYKI